MDHDDNKEIVDLIVKRMNVGFERYGHGLRVGDDTKQWGTQEDSWEEMALEEILDGMVYTASAIIRYRRKLAEVKNIVDNKMKEDECTSDN